MNNKLAYAIRFADAVKVFAAAENVPGVDPAKYHDVKKLIIAEFNDALAAALEPEPVVVVTDNSALAEPPAAETPAT